MNRTQKSLALAAALLMAAASIQAGTAADRTSAASDVSSSVTSPTPAPGVDVQAPVVSPTTAPAARARLAPMHVEIGALVEEEKARVEELNRRFLASSSLSEQIAIQAEIEAVKRDGMLAVFEVQLRYAETEGRTEVVAQLRTTIEAIRNPEPGRLDERQGADRPASGQ